MHRDHVHLKLYKHTASIHIHKDQPVWTISRHQLLDWRKKNLHSAVTDSKEAEFTAPLPRCFSH